MKNKYILLTLLVTATSGCITTKEQRGAVVLTAAKLSGRSEAVTLANLVYANKKKGSDLPAGYGIVYDPVDAKGEIVPGVVGFKPRLVSVVEGEPSFLPSGFIVSSTTNVVVYNNPELEGAYQAGQEFLNAVRGEQ